MARFEEGRGKGAASGGASARLFFPGLTAWAKLCRSYGADCVLEQIKRAGGTPFLPQDKPALQGKIEARRASGQRV
jgi:hypothetical protein